GYLRSHAAPDRRAEDERSLLLRVGTWLGRRVLGPVGEAIRTAGTPAVVRVRLPVEASPLMFLPLELAHAGDFPLAEQDVSLIFEVHGEQPRFAERPIGDRLRVLAVFSLPFGARALNLRRERHLLREDIRTVALTQGRLIELRVLQY